MTTDELRNAVLNNRSDTLMAHRFRQAFGITSVHSYKHKPISRDEFRKRKERREVMRLMAQRVGALDRTNAG